MSAAGLLRKQPDESAKMAAHPMMAKARHVAVWTGGGLRVLVSFEPYGEFAGGALDYRWHVSVSRLDGQVPSWDDVASTVHRVRPGVPMVVGIPPRDQWMSLTGVEVLHAIQVRDENLINRWKDEAIGRRA